jgi:hypothetical protein
MKSDETRNELRDQSRFSQQSSKQGGKMSVDLGYTLQGRGGQAFSWIDTAGGVQVARIGGI